MWGTSEQNNMPGLLLSSGQEMEHDDVCSHCNWTNAGPGAHHWAFQSESDDRRGEESNNSRK